MRKMSSLILGLSLAGSLLMGGVAAADEGGRQERVEVRDHRVVERVDNRVDNRGYQNGRHFDHIVAGPPRVAPPVVVEHVVRRRGYDWMAGEYQWNAGRYELVPGHYIARRAGFRWVAAHWAREGRVFVQIPGHWARV
jgi:hypothetical protein